TSGQGSVDRKGASLFRSTCPNSTARQNISGCGLERAFQKRSSLTFSIPFNVGALFVIIMNAIITDGSNTTFYKMRQQITYRAGDGITDRNEEMIADKIPGPSRLRCFFEFETRKAIQKGRVNDQIGEYIV